MSEERKITLAELAINSECEVRLSVRPRPDVASRVWYRLEWWGDDGKCHYVEASRMSVVMTRVAEIEFPPSVL